MTVFGLAKADEVLQQSQEQGAVVIDARGAKDYWAGHLPGARHVDPALLSLTRTDEGSLDRFNALLAWVSASLGISRASPVVVAGAQNEANAARVVWALAYAGIEHVSLLDGGIKAWRGELTTTAPAIAPTQFELRPNSAYLASAEDVVAASLAESGSVVLDAREWDDYAGKRSNARRAGRVPRARFWDARQELADDGSFAGTAQLEQAAAQVTRPADRTIVYCGGGGRAARSFLALQLAGHRNVAVYPASWNEWGNVETFPVDATLL